MSELVKLVTCLAIVYVQADGVDGLLKAIKTNIIQQPKDTLKVCVPSFVYVIQNNLLYLSASHLDAATYQVNKFLSVLRLYHQNIGYNHTCFIIFSGIIPTENPHNSNVCRVYSTQTTLKNPMDVFTNTCLGNCLSTTCTHRWRAFCKC